MKFSAAIFVAPPVMAHNAVDGLGPAGVEPLATPQADAKLTVDQRSE